MTDTQEATLGMFALALTASLLLAFLCLASSCEKESNRNYYAVELEKARMSTNKTVIIKVE